MNSLMKVDNMSKVAKKIKKGVKSIERSLRGAVKGDIDEILNISTLGASKRLEKLGQKIHEPFKLPDPPPTPGLSQANVQDSAPNVDLARTEGSRRTGGQALGTRKLRVPLGGLR